MADTKALFTQRFDAARTAWTNGDGPAAAESLHWAIVVARSDPSLRRELASALFNLGKLSRKFGRAGEAEAGPLLTEALAISEELYGSRDASLAPLLHELSRLHLQQSQHAQAETVLERLLAIARVNGEEHPDVAATLSDLAFVKRKLGDDASAEALYRDALRIREKALEPNHTLTLGTLERLSETCAARGNFPEALALLHRALPTREATLGPAHERVRAARSRIAELELQMAIAADTAARAARDAMPTPVWLKRVPQAPAPSLSSHAPSPTNSKVLEFLGPSEPVVRPSPRPRERGKTPAVAAAVAASLMASSIPTPSASQIAISQTESARSSATSAGHESGAALRQVALAEVAYGDVAGSDAVLDAWRSTVTQDETDAPEPTRRNQTRLYASVGAAAFAIAIAGMLMVRPRASSGKESASRQTGAPQRAAAGGAAVVTSTAARTASTATGAAAVVAASRGDSLHTASGTTAPATAAARRDQQVPESSTPELRAPNVKVRLDGAINIPTMPAVLSADSIVRSMERQHASDTDRTAPKDEVALPASADVGIPHTSPKIVGRPPEPGFPDELLRAGTREGQVVVRFMVNEVGKVDVASVIVEQSDNELFTAAVRDILPRFRFEPARTPESKPVAAWVRLPFRFTTKKR